MSVLDEQRAAVTVAARGACAASAGDRRFGDPASRTLTEFLPAPATVAPQSDRTEEGRRCTGHSSGWERRSSRRIGFYAGPYLGLTKSHLKLLSNGAAGYGGGRRRPPARPRTPSSAAVLRRPPAAPMCIERQVSESTSAATGRRAH